MTAASSRGDTTAPFSRPRSRRRWLPAAAALSIALASAGFALFGGEGDSETPRRSALPVTPLSVRPESGYEERRTHVGRVEAARISRIGGELGGVIEAMLVDEGEAVRSGQELARFDVARLEARRAELEAERLRQAAVLAELEAGPRIEDIKAQEADLRRLEAASALARSTAARVEKAYRENAVSSQEWDEARLQAEQAEAAAAVAEADLDELRTGTRREKIEAQTAAVRALDAGIRSVAVDIDKGTVRAPFDGQVASRFVDEGEVLQPGAPLLELRERARAGKEGSLEIRVGVLPELAERLAPDTTVPVRFRQQRAEARIRSVRSDRSVDTRTVSVLLTLNASSEGGNGLRDGELVQVDFSRRIESPGMWLPLSALSEGTRGLWRCFVLTPTEDPQVPDATHLLEPRTVEVLHFEAERAYLRGPLEGGALVVAGGTHRLVPGLPVRIATKESPR